MKNANQTNTIPSRVLELSNDFDKSENILYDGKIVLTDNVDNLVYLNKEEAEKALKYGFHVCFVSDKTVDFDEKYKGKHILVREEDVERVLLAMDNDFLQFPVCVSPLYEETFFKPSMIKKALAS